MINRFHLLLFLGYLSVSLMAVSIINADVITIPESGFEEPVTVPPTYPYYCTTDAPSMLPWIGEGASIYDVAGYYGAYGEGNVTNVAGAQCGYLGNQLGIRPYLYQTLPETYEAGNEYDLTVGACLYQGGAVGIVEDQLLSIQLGYWAGDPDGSTGPTIVAERQLALGDLLEGTLTDYTVSTGAVSGDAVGKNIVVYLSRAAGAPAGRQYSLDNVRLVETVVPEPGTLVLLASGLLRLLVCAWRKRG